MKKTKINRLYDLYVDNPAIILFECTGCPHYGYCIPDDCANMKKTHEQQPLVKGQRRKTSISRILQRKRKDNGIQNFY